MSRSAWEWPNILIAAIVVTLGAVFVGSLLFGNLSHGYVIPGQIVFCFLSGIITALFWILAWRSYRKAKVADTSSERDEQKKVWPPPPVLKPPSQE